MRTSTFIVSLAALLAVAASAQPPAPTSQPPQPVRVRGTIQSFDGQKIAIATKSEGVVQLAVTEQTGINGLEAKRAADIGDNTFIGATAVKDAAGRWLATEIHIFPESMRGAGEGHYAWDLPESSMTNGAVTGNVAGTLGPKLRVKYKDGETEIDVTPRTAIVALTIGDRALLKPGATVFALAIPQPGGGASAVAIIAETKGVKPPM
jgi:hypothetical protein